MLGATDLAYFVLVIAFSLAVSARARSSRLALVALLTFWFANSLVAGRAASDLAGYLYPTPSAIEFQKSMDADLNNEAEMKQRLDRRRAEVLKQYGVDNVDALPISFAGISMQEGEEHGNEVFDKHYGQLFDRYEQQDRVYQVGGVIAPMLSVRAISMGLAGTDFQQHRHFAVAAERYRRLIERTMNGDIAAHTKKGEVYLADQSLWASVPDFEYLAPPAGWVLGHYTTSLLVMALWIVGAVAFMLRSSQVARAD
jgi:ABC-2 type transport system permease protein